MVARSFAFGRKNLREQKVLPGLQIFHVDGKARKTEEGLFLVSLPAVGGNSLLTFFLTFITTPPISIVTESRLEIGVLISRF